MRYSTPVRNEPAANIAVVMPVKNGQQFIAAAIESLLHQRLLPAQIIVVDDGSTDNTRARLEAEFGDRIRLLSQPNRGVSAARNAGIAESTGAFIALTQRLARRPTAIFRFGP